MSSSALPISRGDSLHGVARHALPATAVTIAVTLLLAPLVHWQYGSAGVAVVGLLAVAVILAVVVSAWAERSLTRSGRELAGVLAAMGIRMCLPLAAALAIVIGGRQLVPVQAVLYVVPMYLAMLAVETRLAVRRIAGHDRGGRRSPGDADPTIGKRG